MAKFEDVDLEKESIVRFGEHEILMSFNDDDGAYAFDAWWADEGSEVFGRFYETWKPY